MWFPGRHSPSCTRRGMTTKALILLTPAPPSHTHIRIGVYAFSRSMGKLGCLRLNKKAAENINGHQHFQKLHAIKQTQANFFLPTGIL